MIDRRTLLGAFAAISAVGTPALLAEVRPELMVFKDPDCGCCNAWIDIMAAAGFQTRSQNVSHTELVRFKLQNGIMEEMMSCHTAIVEGYLIEGHVPPADVLRLLEERPDAIGLTVPGMPYGSPGMGPESEREAYDVFLIRRDGTADVYARYDAG